MSDPIREVCAVAGPIRRGETRRREVAAVAERMFFENGFSDTTMQMIAMRAGASKETLYRHFGSKEGLFAEIVETRARGFLNDFDENFDRPNCVAEVLRNLALKLTDALIDAGAIPLCRTVIAEAHRNPELGEIFFSRGPERVRRRLTEFLVAARDRGELACKDPDLVASIFLGAIMSQFHLMRLLLQTPPNLTRAHLENHVDEVVEMFLFKYSKRAA